MATTSGIIFIPFLVARSVELFMASDDPDNELAGQRSSYGYPDSVPTEKDGLGRTRYVSLITHARREVGHEFFL